MNELAVRNICGVIIVTEDVERLAQFYRDVIGLDLDREEHAGLPVHYGTALGTIHFGIHPPGSYHRSSWPRGGSVVALTVDSIDSCQHWLQARGIETSEVRDEGFGPLLTLQDPDGNLVEFVELRHDFAGNCGGH